jgi:hypothetical protein
MFKHLVFTSKKAQCVSMATVNWLTLFKELICVYTENLTKHTNIFCGQNAELLLVKAGGAYNYHWVLKG